MGRLGYDGLDCHWHLLCESRMHMSNDEEYDEANASQYDTIHLFKYLRFVSTYV